MKKNGFTLVELMIVVTILGILAAIVIPEFQGHAAESRESAVKSSLHTVRCQIELYKMQHNNLNPGYFGANQASAAMIGDQFTGTSRIDGFAISTKTPSDPFLYGPYLMEMPVNPFNNLSDVKPVASGVTDFSTVADDSTGWLYQKETATFKINYSGADSDDVSYVDY
jgi:general secretion pathway protein G